MVRTRSAGWLAGLSALAVLLLALSAFPPADAIEARAAALLGPALSALHTAVRPLSDVVLHAGQVARLTAQNDELRQQVARLESEAATLREAGATAEQSAALRSAVGSAAGDAAGHLVAPVIVRDPAPGRRAVLIGRGAADGVLVGQPVLGPAATLVGIVVEAQAHSARVRLLDDLGSTVAAVLQQPRTPGALAGGPGGLHLDLVPLGVPATRGDLVLSSPLGGLLPGGLLIGRVSEVQFEPHDLFQTIRVEPLADYTRLEHVLVVTGFAPERPAR